MNALQTGMRRPEKTPANTNSILLAAIEGLSFGFLSLSLYAIPMAIAYIIFNAFSR